MLVWRKNIHAIEVLLSWKHVFPVCGIKTKSTDNVQCGDFLLFSECLLKAYFSISTLLYSPLQAATLLQNSRISVCPLWEPSSRPASLSLPAECIYHWHPAWRCLTGVGYHHDLGNKMDTETHTKRKEYIHHKRLTRKHMTDLFTTSNQGIEIHLTTTPSFTTHILKRTVLVL